MNARKLCAGTQRGHIRSCKRFAAFLKRSPDTATLEDIRGFQLHLADTGVNPRRPTQKNPHPNPTRNHDFHPGITAVYWAKIPFFGCT
jgi:hypothetical protein